MDESARRRCSGEDSSKDERGCDAHDVLAVWATDECPFYELFSSHRRKSFIVKLELCTHFFLAAKIIATFGDFFPPKNAGCFGKNAGMREMPQILYFGMVDTYAMVKIGSHTNLPNTLVSAASVRWWTLAEKVYCGTFYSIFHLYRDTISLLSAYKLYYVLTSVNWIKYVVFSKNPIDSSTGNADLGTAAAHDRMLDCRSSESSTVTYNGAVDGSVTPWQNQNPYTVLDNWQ